MDALLKEKNLQDIDTESIPQPILSRSGQGKSYATFGELLQGVLPSGRNFLVTFPIRIYSSAYFEYAENIPLIVFPSHKTKSLKLAELVLGHFELPLQGKLIIRSDIPEGKGMASSSSDLVATARAIADCFNYSLMNSLLESFLAEIEPSDGVMYDGCVSYYQREALLRSYLGFLPSILVLGIDEGGEVDTIQFNAKRKNFTSAEKYEYSVLLQKLENAIRKKDIRTIGKVSTRSALLNQKLKANKYLDIFINISEEVQSIGIAIAHSGTCIGLLFDKNDQFLDAKLDRAKALFRSNNIFEESMIYNSLSFYTLGQ